MDREQLKEELRYLRECLERGDITDTYYQQAVTRLHAAAGSAWPGDPFATPPGESYTPRRVIRLLDLLPNQEIGPGDNRFRLVREIGGGAMGRVWLAHDLEEEKLEGGERYKALKVVNPQLQDLPRALELLKREAARASQLTHPNIINVRGWRQGRDGWLFVVMDYLEGRDLDRLLLEEGIPGLSWERTLALLEPIAAGLDYAHAQGILHRDLKPGNVFITQRQEVKLLDFGLAYRLHRSSTMVGIQETDASGTPEYMPPEAFVAGEPDKARDIYALACLTYEMLTGEPPFSPEAARWRNSSLLPGKPRVLSEAAWEVLKSGLAYRKEERPGSAGELMRRLVAAQRAEPEPVKKFSLPPQPKAKKPWLALLAVAVVLVAVGIIYSMLTQVPEPVPVPAPVPDPVEKPIEKESVEEAAEPLPAKPDLPSVQNIHGWAADKVKALQSQTAAALGMEVEFKDKLEHGSLGPTMVVIPAGEFLMGSPEDEEGRDDDERQHEVRIEQPFAMGKYEVTVGQFRAFVEAKDYKTGAERGDGCYNWIGSEWKPDKQLDWRNPGYSQDENHPVVCVSWNDAVAYAEWLSEQTNQSYRLPTEAEWEYASRAGTMTARYWGDDPDNGCAYANARDQIAKTQFGWSNVMNCQDGYAYTAPVGRFRANEWDLYDMLGNVWEWTCSGYDKNYSGDKLRCAEKNRANSRVRRGGSWSDSVDGVRAAHRGRNTPARRYYYLGFRLARQF